MICEKSKCTGCFACYNICPKQAIEMQEDENGFIYPQINKDKCIECNLCKRVCPSLNLVQKNTPLYCYAAFAKEKEIRNRSTSGGIATIFSKYVIENDGIVYGASFIEGCKVAHIRISEIQDLEKLQGSKYVHSYIKDTYRLVKTDLKNGKNVLFVGTPCQVAGLKKYLNKNYDNLILIDIICHGVPSQKYLQEEVNRLVGTCRIDRVNFRIENDYGLYVIKDNKQINGNDISNSPYADAFMSGLSLRENCQSCMYAGDQRISDITIGDFWGLKEDSKFYDGKEKGISVIIITTKKGEYFFNKTSNLIEFEKRNYEEAVDGNTQLRHPVMNKKKSKKFKREYIKSGFKQAYQKVTILSRLKRNIKKVIKKMVKNEC